MYFSHTSRRRRNVPPQDHHSPHLERTQRSSSRFACSSLKNILHSFSTAFRVDFISLDSPSFSWRWLPLVNTPQGVAGPPATSLATAPRLRPEAQSFCGSISVPLDRQGSVIHLLQPRHRDEVLILVRDFHTNHCDRLGRWTQWTILPLCNSCVAQSSRATSVEDPGNS